MAETDTERAERFAREAAATPTLTEAEYRVRSRRSVLFGGAAALAGVAGWRWIQTRPEDNNIPSVLRDAHEFNEALWTPLHRDDHLAPTFDRSESSILRVNGRHGLRNEEEIDIDAWRLDVRGPDGDQIGEYSLADIQALPKVEWTVEHKCIEGWSHVVTWGGVTFSDFAELHRADLGDGGTTYVNLDTPDGEYFVSVDWASMMHPQTMLAWELEGEPLDFPHGAPLRLATPVKYGIKQIKRIGTIEFSNQRGPDFWESRGYDWYAHL
ncbi:MAG: molybdopterin-dependent oxidoreductase [Actinomycetota bacterium]